MPIEYNFQVLLGKKVLITGDVGSGKTRLTLELLEDAIRLGYSDEITIIDMAPARVEVNRITVGGKLIEFSNKLEGIRYLFPKRVATPRLSAKSANELLHLVDLNEKHIRPILKEYQDKPTPILFVNDISIYLQSGFAELIISVIAIAKTFIANGYYGRRLEPDFKTGISNIERKLMIKLSNNVDVAIKL